MTESYAIAGRVVRSLIKLPELREARRSTPVWLTIARGPPPPTGQLMRRYADDDGFVWQELERTATGYRFHLPDTADMGFDRSASRLTVHPAAGTSAADLRHALLDQVIPLLLVLEGSTVFHASAVAVGSASGRRALLFAGESGAGKSTTAASCQLAGATLLADDFALVDTTLAHPTLTPSGTGSRLCRDVVAQMEAGAVALAVPGDEDKSRLPPAPGLQGLTAVPIAAIYLLGERSGSGTDPAVTRLGPGEACISLMHHSFRAALDDTLENQSFMEATARLVERVAVRRLTVPCRLDDLAAIGGLILQEETRRSGDSTWCRASYAGHL